MIEFHHVTKRYSGNVTALDAADFRVEPSEFVLLTGPNGAGKSTVLKLLYLDEQPDEGEISMTFGPDQVYNSRERIAPKRVQWLRRHLGVVFQDFKLLPDRDVFENVALALRVSGVPEPRLKERVVEVLALTGLSHRQRSLPHELSGGEQQRVAIARAVANEPYVLLADEPTGNLDPETSQGILRLFQDIHALGATVIMATHDEPLIQNLPYRRIRLERGAVTSPEFGRSAV
jgi:cell division transport system ATP-binding protein